MKKLIPIFLSLTLLTQTAFAATVSEQELEQIKAQLQPVEEIENCVATLGAVYDAKTLDFLTFLESHFTNKSSTSSLTNTAILRYASYKQEIESEFANLRPIASGSENPNTYESEFEAYQRCSEMTDLYLESAKDQMLRHIKANAAVKRTTVMLEKYKGINSKLNDLNFEMASMFAKFMTFNNKLPGFIAKCIGN